MCGEGDGLRLAELMWDTCKFSIALKSGDAMTGNPHRWKNILNVYACLNPDMKLNSMLDRAIYPIATNLISEVVILHDQGQRKSEGSLEIDLSGCLTCPYREVTNRFRIKLNPLKDSL